MGKIVEERGQKWIVNKDPPKDFSELFEIPRNNVPFHSRGRLILWGNYKLLMKMEFLFFYIPTFIILGLVLPSFACIYGVDEAVATTMTVKVTARQWYWVYEVQSPTDDEGDD